MTFKLTKIAAAATVAASLTFSLAFAADATTTDNTAATNTTTTTAPTTSAPTTAAPTMMDHVNKAADAVKDTANQAADQIKKAGEQAGAKAGEMLGTSNKQDTSAADANTSSSDSSAPTMEDGAKTPSTDSSTTPTSGASDTTNKTDATAPNKIYVTPTSENKDASTTTTDADKTDMTTAAPTADNKSASDQANAVIPQEKLLAFAQKAALASFTYDYSNYQQDMKNMQSYFTKTGWESFNKALTASNNLDVVQKEKLTVSATMNGEAEVTQHQQTATGQEWQVTVPVIVTYKNDKNQKIQQDLKVKLAIDTVDTNENPNGMGINQFIAMPDGNASPKKAS